jgi:hypothetical protein
MPFVGYKLPVTTDNRFFVTTQLPQQNRMGPEAPSKKKGPGGQLLEMPTPHSHPRFLAPNNVYSRRTLRSPEELRTCRTKSGSRNLKTAGR